MFFFNAAIGTVEAEINNNIVLDYQFNITQDQIQY